MPLPAPISHGCWRRAACARVAPRVSTGRARGALCRSRCCGCQPEHPQLCAAPCQDAVANTVPSPCPGSSALRQHQGRMRPCRWPGEALGIAGCASLLPHTPAPCHVPVLGRSLGLSGSRPPSRNVPSSAEKRWRFLTGLEGGEGIKPAQNVKNRRTC